MERSPDQNGASDPARPVTSAEMRARGDFIRILGASEGLATAISFPELEQDHLPITTELIAEGDGQVILLVEPAVSATNGAIPR